MIITEEPEFVFDFNLAKGIGRIDRENGFFKGIDEAVEACFRKFSRKEARNIKKGDQFYIKRIIYGDERFPYVDGPPSQLLGGYVKATAIGKKEIDHGRIVLRHKTAGIPEAECHMHFYLPEWQPGFYCSPDLEKVNQLIAQYGEGIVIPPTKKEWKDIVKREKLL